MPTSRPNPVTPTGAAYLFKNVPLDKNYTHTLFFASHSDINSELKDLLTSQSYSYVYLASQTYTRITTNVMRVSRAATELQGCNYLAFYNGASGGFPGQPNKYFYAFIDNVEYVNNTTADVYFTIDVMQTYQGDYYLGDNFVEREQIAASEDKIGANMVPEGLELGELIVSKHMRRLYSMNAPYTIIMYSANEGGTNPYVAYVTGASTPLERRPSVPSGQLQPSTRNKFGNLCCLAIPYEARFAHVPAETDNSVVVMAAIKTLTDASANIVAMFNIDAEMYEDNFISGSSLTHRYDFDQEERFIDPNSSTNDYTSVRNMKLLQYPYTRVIVSNGNGANSEFKWELFSENAGDLKRAHFNIINAMLPQPKALAYPVNYRGLDVDMDSPVAIEDFPQPSWTEDSFSKWWAQNKLTWGLSLASSVVQAGVNVATAGAGSAARAGQLASAGSENLANFTGAMEQHMPTLAGNYRRAAESNFASEATARSLSAGSKARAGASGIGGIASCMAQYYSAKAVPDSAHVQNNAGVINALAGRFGFSFQQVSVTAEMARNIDKYFDMFGYATNRVKIPNMSDASKRRPHWNYVKLQNANITPNRSAADGLPGDAKAAIEAIYNNGITFWNNISEIGDYSFINK